MRYSITFLALAAACVFVAVAAWDAVGWAVVVPLYTAASFALLAVAYAGVGARLLLKRADGRRSPLAWPLFAPYFLLNTVAFEAYRRLSREPAFAEVIPNLSFGRKLTPREAEAGGWDAILDLAGEFAAGRWQRARPNYRSLPILDAAAPSEAELRAAVAWLRDATAAGPVYVHCALGHGRSACVVVAYLLSVGTVGTVADGVKLLRALRTGVRLHPPQRRLLRRFEPRPGNVEIGPSAVPDTTGA